jgi:hypothetical protein
MLAFRQYANRRAGIRPSRAVDQDKCHSAPGVDQELQRLAFDPKGRRAPSRRRLREIERVVDQAKTLPLPCLAAERPTAALVEASGADVRPCREQLRLIEAAATHLLCGSKQQAPPTPCRHRSGATNIRERWARPTIGLPSPSSARASVHEDGLVTYGCQRQEPRRAYRRLFPSIFEAAPFNHSGTTPGNRSED